MHAHFARYFAVISLVFFAVSARADRSKVLLISDIDDTIKVSHVLSTLGKVGRAADVTTPFLGMAALYQLVVNDNPQSAKIVYLSNAPDEIGGIPALKISHETFLKRNHFPAGELLLRDGLFEENHKLKEIRRLIESENPEVLILVGDNGEKDAVIYEQIVHEYAVRTDMKIITYIHQLYASRRSFLIPDFLEEIGLSLHKDQIGFVTPVEISLDLQEKGVLSIASVDWMIKNVAPRIVSESRFKWDGLEPISFPGYKKCEDFKWRFATSQALSGLIRKIELECN